MSSSSKAFANSSMAPIRTFEQNCLGGPFGGSATTMLLTNTLYHAML